MRPFFESLEKMDQDRPAAYVPTNPPMVVISYSAKHLADWLAKNNHEAEVQTIELILRERDGYVFDQYEGSLVYV